MSFIIFEVPVFLGAIGASGCFSFSADTLSEGSLLLSSLLSLLFESLALSPSDSSLEEEPDEVVPLELDGDSGFEACLFGPF